LSTGFATSSIGAPPSRVAIAVLIVSPLACSQITLERSLTSPVIWIAPVNELCAGSIASDAP
jgi:hypothetical protein